MPQRKKHFVKVVHQPTEKYQEIERPKKEILLNNFLGGISWGLGATVGVSVIVSILIFILHYIGFIPIIGNFATDITKYVQQHK